MKNTFVHIFKIILEQHFSMFFRLNWSLLKIRRICFRFVSSVPLLTENLNASLGMFA